MKKKNVVGGNIRTLRLKTGITQEELALKSGLSQGYVNQLESGKRRFTQKTLELIADALSTPMLELFKENTPHVPVVKEPVATYKKKRPSRREFLALLNELPEHIIDHYFTLLKCERNMWKKRLSP